MGVIKASDIQALGRKIGTMYSKRKNPIEGGLFTSGATGNGAITLSAGVYGTSETTSAGTAAYAAVYNKTIGVLGKMVTTISSSLAPPATVAAGTAILTQTKYDAAVTWTNSFYNIASNAAVTASGGYTSANKKALTGCNGFCTGLCAGTCYNECTGSCSGTSSGCACGGCDMACTGQCMNNCYSAAYQMPGQGCDDCFGTCYISCGGYCGEACGMCGSICYGCQGCGNSCGSYCTNDCFTSCKSGCSNSTKTS